MFRYLLAGAAALLFYTAVPLSTLTGAAAAQENYPEKPIRWLLGFRAGGASDLLARTVGRELGSILGQEIVIDNRPGASGIIAAGLTAQSEPDGYTMVLISSSYINNIAMGREFDFEPIDDFEPVTNLAYVPNVVVVPPEFEASSMQELIELAMERPGELNYASGGPGTGTHIGTELFKLVTGTDIAHVPYSGTPPALLDVMAGRMEIMFAGLPPALSHIRSGELKALAVTSLDRLDELPDLPTVAETVPDFEAITSYAVLAPKGTPQEIVNKLNSAFHEALAKPSVRETLINQGFIPSPSSPDELLSEIEQLVETNAQVVEAAGIEVQ